MGGPIFRQLEGMGGPGLWMCWIRLQRRGGSEGEVQGWAEELSERVRALGQGTGGGVSDGEKILKTGTDEMAMEYDRKHGDLVGRPSFQGQASLFSY